MLSVPIRKILASSIASIPANRQGLGSRVKIVRGGVGFLPASYDGYDTEADALDWNDYTYSDGYGNYGDFGGANPPDFWDDYDYTTPGISPYVWGGNDGSVSDDPGLWNWIGGYNDYTDASGNEWFYNSLTGNYEMAGGDGGTIYIAVDDYGVTPTDYSAINDTLDWWSSIATGGVTVSDTDLDAIISDPGLHSMGGIYSGNPPPVTAPKKDKLAWLKKMAEEAKKALAKGGPASSASAASGSKPVQPKANGQCPTGYVKNAQGQCVKAPVSAQQNSLGGILSNPLYLALGAIGLILLAKK